jgi:hypothetical protein
MKSLIVHINVGNILILVVGLLADTGSKGQ